MLLLKIVGIIFIAGSVVIALGLLSSSITVLTKFIPPFDKYPGRLSCYQEYQQHEVKFVTQAQRIEGWKYCRDNNIIKAAGDLGIIGSIFLFGAAVFIYLKRPRFSAFFHGIAFIFSIIAFILPFTMRDAPLEDTEDLCRYVIEDRNYHRKQNMINSSSNANNSRSVNGTGTATGTGNGTGTATGTGNGTGTGTGSQGQPDHPNPPPNHLVPISIIDNSGVGGAHGGHGQFDYDDDDDSIFGGRNEFGHVGNHFEHGFYVCWKGGIHNFHNMSTERINSSPANRALYDAAVSFLFFAILATCVNPLAATALIFYSLRNVKNKVSPSSSFEYELESTATPAPEEQIQTADAALVDGEPQPARSDPTT